MPFLDDYQIDAIRRMKNGCILNGSVGSGKSRTGIAYYYLVNGGKIDTDEVTRMPNPTDLYIITTAQKRDLLEWESELAPFGIICDSEKAIYKHKVVIDSWNNVGKYAEVTGAFFIFDEQRVVGKGKWAKTFIKIAKSNKWILLTATAGDNWSDYATVFIANGFFRNRTQFNYEHVIFDPHVTFPKIKGYLGEGYLMKLRNSILVDMDYKNQAEKHFEDLFVSFNVDRYRTISRDRWDIWANEPIETPSKLCYNLRRVVNEDVSRQIKLLEVLEDHPKAIIFYNYNYELDILRQICGDSGFEIGEWNGQKHENVPNSSSRWVYLVNYSAGSEGWNCITTDTTIFYSQNYSYKRMVQASGRIDRRNTTFKDLYYFNLKSRSGIDLAISKALSAKKDFNETKFVNWR